MRPAALLPARPTALVEDRALRGRVLLVDDEPDNIIGLQYLLALEGHEVEIAFDGATALARVAGFDPDVVICDLGLPPPWDGYSLAARIRELHGAYIHLCAFSGFGSREHVERSIASGFDVHLTKPGTPATLSAQIQRGLLQLQAARASAARGVA